MTILPFVCLGIGICLGLILKNQRIVNSFDKLSTVALITLMLTIGIGIGADETVINQIGSIGFNCMVISICAISFSVLFTLLCEKTILPLKQLDDKLSNEKELQMEFNSIDTDTKEEKKTSHLVWIMPASIILGVVIGVIARSSVNTDFTDYIFTGALIVLYICVGVSQGSNRDVFKYIRLLGFKVVLLSIAILLGSLVGGFIASLLLDVPIEVCMISSGGMSFYSITGAYMTKTFGLALGTYGFIVNVMREFFTVLLMPLLIKISLGSPIAGGAAGDMDTMLAPITKFVGVRLGLVTLITGTILTFVVPFLLPLLASCFNVV